MQLSESLRRFRREFKVTQREAALAGGVTERNYQKYESDKMVPAVTIVMGLADKFNVSTDYLLGRTDNPAVNYSPSNRGSQ